MVSRTGIAFFVAFVLLGLPLTLIAAGGGDELARLQSAYRRPAKIPFPADNPYTNAKSSLGKMLFFDPRLSGSRTISCSTCHLPTRSWSDGLSHARGEDPAGMTLRSPTLIDVAFVEPLGWDGKFHDIEDVTFSPISSRLNMNMPKAELLTRLAAVPGYVSAFTEAFGDGAITTQRIEQALATYERTIVAGDAPFDRWIRGDKKAISAEAKRGFLLFNGKARCSGCHSGPSFTDGSFQDIGTATGNDIGRGRLFPNSEKLRYAFKTPTLRDIARRPPYMHDGSVATLQDVIELYNKGGIDRPSRSPLIKPLFLTTDEKADLIAFLQTLTGSSPPEKPPALPE
ncbi:MAG: c-type cytochrome [Bradyrhizobiaceae bacterium]|nr:MAG: c-type cytochrome [Bradyrhizobiaceae bacterium]